MKYPQTVANLCEKGVGLSSGDAYWPTKNKCSVYLSISVMDAGQGGAVPQQSSSSAAGRWRAPQTAGCCQGNCCIVPARGFNARRPIWLFAIIGFPFP